MQNFFNIQTSYQFEMNDLRALSMILNVMLVMLFGFASSWFGFSIALFGIVKDCQNKNRHINDFLIHFASLSLNIYFLKLLYWG